MTIEIERLDRIKASNRVFGIFRGVTPLGKTPGNVFYVDYVNGDDNNDGRMISTAKRTIGSALTLCVNNNNDTIFVQEGDYNNEQVTVNVAGVHIIGPNPRTLVTGVSFIVTADNVEIAGFLMNHSSVDYLVEITGDYCYLHHCMIYRVLEDDPFIGLRLHNSSNSILEDNRILIPRGPETTALPNLSHGILITGTSNDCAITRNEIYACDGDGIRLVGGTAHNLYINYNKIFSCANIGINIAENNNDNYVYNNVISGNDQDISDAGSDNFWVNNKDLHRFGSLELIADENVVLDDYDLGKSGMVSIDFDINITPNTTVIAKLYKKIDDTNYRIIDLQTAISGQNALGVSGFFQGGRDRLRVTIECDPDRIDDVVEWKLIEV